MKLSEEISVKGDEERLKDLLIRLAAERGHILADWHFELLKHLPDAVRVLVWFGNAVVKNGRMYFNGNLGHERLAYDWVKSHYGQELGRTFTELTVCLAKDGQILKSFEVNPKQTRNPKALAGIAGAAVTKEERQ